MNTLKNIIVYGLGAATVIAIVMLTSYTKPHLTDSSSQTDTAGFFFAAASPSTEDSTIYPPQKVHAPQMPKAVDFAGEPLPIENFDAKERFDRELISNCFRHSSTFMFLKRANRYFPIIEPILAENGIPDDFKYLAVAESALSNAVSPAGARGFWQFMPKTAQERKLEVNREVDERYHLEKATQAACQYLKTAYKEFNSWTLAAASYNMGRAGLRNRIQQQGGKNYFDLFLNSETSRYVLRIMAIKEIMKSPKTYGFHTLPRDLYPAFPPYREVEVKGSISSLPDFAKKHETSYRLLKVYNPWLRNLSLTNKNKKTYYIKIPK